MNDQSVDYTSAVTHMTKASGSLRWRFSVLFLVQTIGAIILFWNAVPL